MSSDHPEFSFKSPVIVVGKIFGLAFPLYLAHYNEFFSLWMWPVVSSMWGGSSMQTRGSEDLYCLNASPLWWQKMGLSCCISSSLVFLYNMMLSTLGTEKSFLALSASLCTSYFFCPHSNDCNNKNMKCKRKASNKYRIKKIRLITLQQSVVWRWQHPGLAIMLPSWLERWQWTIFLSSLFNIHQTRGDIFPLKFQYRQCSTDI